MKKIIFSLSLFLCMGTSSLVYEANCFNVNVGIQITTHRIDKKKSQVIIGKLYSMQGRSFLKPEIIWGQSMKKNNDVEIFFPERKKFFYYEKMRKAFYSHSCEPDYSLKDDDRVVVFNAKPDSKIIDFSNLVYKFYILDRKNDKNVTSKSVEVNEPELIKLLDSAFGKPTAF